MRWTVEKKLAIAFFLALSQLIVNAVISFRASRTLIRNEQSVSHTLRVLNELEATLSTMKDAETGQRGHLITGNKGYLKPYQSAVDEINQPFKNLKQLTADNASQQAHMPFLKVRLPASSTN